MPISRCRDSISAPSFEIHGLTGSCTPEQTSKSLKDLMQLPFDRLDFRFDFPDTFLMGFVRVESFQLVPYSPLLLQLLFLPPQRSGSSCRESPVRAPRYGQQVGIFFSPVDGSREAGGAGLESACGVPSSPEYSTPRPPTAQASKPSPLSMIALVTLRTSPVSTRTSFRNSSYSLAVE